MILTRPLRHTLACAALMTSALCAVPALAQHTAPVPSGVTTQLPRGVSPSHYAIHVVPRPDALRFDAQASIDITVAQATRTITLNAAELAIATARIDPVGKGRGMAGTVALDPATQTATITFRKPVKPGNHRLSFAYAGVINTQATGLFALDYQDTQGAAKRALFTQFEAPDARRFVPSWDEPSYKATFDLTVDAPTGQTVVSNMPVAAVTDIGDGRTRHRFGTSPKMSTYLLFMGMGELDRATRMVGPTELGVLTGRGNTSKAQLALDASVEILPYFNDWFGVPYPLPKLDNVAGPGQSQFFSAMENWGAIFTFERAMLVDPRSTSEATKRRIYEIVAHEMAHQWFGNLVTMAWWDDLWLNEGFASWMATKVSDRMNPKWEMLLIRVDGRESAMALDALSTTHPVVQKISTVDEVTQAFDAITYEKGEAVIAMFESFAGEDVWRDGIRAYMKRHAYGNTQTRDLWAAVESAGAKGLSVIADDFTTKPGIPLVKVDAAQCVNGTTRLSLSQGEFSRDAKDAKDAAPLRWHVPVRAQVTGQAERALVLDGTASIDLPGCGAYVINVGQAGYYRSLYPAENMTALARDFTALPSIDQLGLLADNWQLGLGGYQPMNRALDLIGAVPATASDAILASLPGYYDALSDMFDGDAPTQGKVLALASARLSPVLGRIGMDARAGEGPQVPLLRQQLVATLGAMGEPAVVAEARRRFAALDTDPAALDGPLKFTWLGIVARYADAPTWDKIRGMANKATSALDKAQLFALLGRTQDEALATRALDLAMTDEPGKTTSAAIIAAVSGEHAMKALEYVLAHKAQYDTLVDASGRTQALARLGANSADLRVADLLDTYATSALTPESRKVVDRAIAAIKTRAATRVRLKPDVLRWVEAAGAKASLAPRKEPVRR